MSVILGMKGKGGSPYLIAFRREQENCLAEQVGNRMNENLTLSVSTQKKKRNNNVKKKKST